MEGLDLKQLIQNIYYIFIYTYMYRCEKLDEDESEKKETCREEVAEIRKKV